MNNAPHRYPVGIQAFDEIRAQGYLYADKTGYIWDLIQTGGKYRFLSRPRRFGKTLLVSTMEAYFQGRKELFRGLEIERLDTREVWPEHPVIRLDLSDFKSTDVDGLRAEFDRMLAPYEEAYGVQGCEGSPGICLDRIICAAAAISAAAKPVVLIDAYDAPLLNVMNDANHLERFQQVMREFFSPLKKNEPNLDFFFMTGVTKYEPSVLTGELDNMLDVSMLPRFAGICGVTVEELDGLLAPEVHRLSERLGFSKGECRSRLRMLYGGYRFTDDSPEILNPACLTAACDNIRLGNHWLNSDDLSSCLNMFGKPDVQFEDFERIRLTGNAFNAPVERMREPVAFMYQNGFLTIKGYDRRFGFYKLGFPNDFVRELFRNACYSEDARTLDEDWIIQEA